MMPTLLSQIRPPLNPYIAVPTLYIRVTSNEKGICSGPPTQLGDSLFSTIEELFQVSRREVKLSQRLVGIY